MKTGSHLKIQSMGTNVLGVVLEGNPRKPEPESFRVEFPGGEVDIERCTDGTYWIHLLVNEPAKTIDREGPNSGTVYGRFTEARLHMTGKHTADAIMGDFENPGLYDVALRVSTVNTSEVRNA